VLGAAGDVVPGSAADESEVDGEDADGSVAGGEDAGGDEAGGDDAGGEDAGGDDAGGDDAGGDEAGGDEAGGDEAGGDDAGGEDFAGLLGLEDEDEDEDVGGCVENWDTIGVGARDVLEARDRVGLRYMLGETRAAADGTDEDDGPGLAAGLDDAAAGEVATAPAPACGCRWLAAGVWWLAPIRVKAATAEPATSPPVRHAEASGREIRCRPGPPVPRRRC
jgi:hypothetical protein